MHVLVAFWLMENIWSHCCLQSLRRYFRGGPRGRDSMMTTRIRSRERTHSQLRQRSSVRILCRTARARCRYGTVETCLNDSRRHYIDTCSTPSSLYIRCPTNPRIGCQTGLGLNSQVFYQCFFFLPPFVSGTTSLARFIENLLFNIRT